MKSIKISRSYSAKKQIAQYEPIESFCAAEAEVEEAEMELASASLDRFVRGEVEKTLKEVMPEPLESEMAGTPIPIFHPKKPSNLTPDQYGYVHKKSKCNPPAHFYEKDEVVCMCGLKARGQTINVRKSGEKKIDLRGEPKSRDVGRDSAEHDTIQEIE